MPPIFVNLCALFAESVRVDSLTALRGIFFLENTLLFQYPAEIVHLYFHPSLFSLREITYITGKSHLKEKMYHPCLGGTILCEKTEHPVGTVYTEVRSEGSNTEGTRLVSS